MPYDDLRQYPIQVRQRGQVTIPRKVRESLAIEEGDTLVLLPVGETMILVPRQSRAPELMDRLAHMLEESDVSLADLLADLPGIRETIYRERQQANDQG